MKKGMQFGVIVGLIIIVAVFVMVIFSLKGILDDSGEAVDRNKCKLAIQVASSQNFAKLGREIKGACDIMIVNLDTEDKDEIMQTVAEEMKWCYSYIGRGNADMTSNFDFWFRDRNSCLYCAIISFGDKSKKLEEIDGRDFRDYLIENPRGEETYAEFFRLNELQKEKVIDFPDIKLDENLEIFDFMTKEPSWTSKLSIGGGILGGASLLLFTPIGPFVAGGVPAVGIAIGVYNKYSETDIVTSVGYSKSGTVVGEKCQILN